MEVLENLHRMAELGIPLKVNAVAMRGQNEAELPALAALAMDHAIDVRFIEFMPMGEDSIGPTRCSGLRPTSLPPPASIGNSCPATS